MGLLTKSDILAQIESGTLGFTPELDEFQIQPHAIDLRLGFTFLIARHWILNRAGRIALTLDHLAGSGAHFDTIELEPGQIFEILPGEGVIVATLEKIRMPANLVGNIYPRSSVNRQGLAVDLSGIVDAGYEGNLIIPVRNNNISTVVRLYPAERFCQLTLTSLDEPAEVRQSRYHKRDIATGVLPEQNQEEMDFIRQGNVKALKERFGVLRKRED
jgi:dCTP deaminase